MDVTVELRQSSCGSTMRCPFRFAQEDLKFVLGFFVVSEVRINFSVAMRSVPRSAPEDYTEPLECEM